LVLIPNIQFNFLVNSAANCSSLSNIILFSNLCNFHMLSLNSLVNSSADVLSTVATKYDILDNLLHTTKVTFFSTTNSNFVIKSTVKYIHSLSGISFTISFPTSTSVQFFIFWYILHLSIYFCISFITPGYQQFLVTSFIIFYLSSCSTTSISWYNQIISTLNSLSFSIYTFLLSLFLLAVCLLSTLFYLKFFYYYFY